MIAGCPKCSARYRVDPEQISEAGAKLRCTKCSAVFLVRVPRTVAPEVAPVPEPVVAPQPKMPIVSDPTPPVDDATDSDAPVLVLVADPSEERGKQILTVIEGWGLNAALVQDGVEAMLAIQRLLPKVVVLDAALPKMFGFQVCEVVKRNESLRHIHVVLVGAIHHQDRYRRGPSDLYGADIYLEQPDLPDGLLPLLRDAGLAVESGAPTAPTEDPAGDPNEVASPLAPPALTASPEPLEFDEPTGLEAGDAANDSALDFSDTPDRSPPSLEFVEEPPAAPRVAAEPEPVVEEDPERAAERERAERLARIAVSEMLLYQPEKFDQAVRDGNIEAVLDLEIGEARALIRQRISEEVRAEKDFILVELERVARERGSSR